MAFHIPNKRPTDEQLIGFHLSLPMGYVDSAPYFRMSTETILEMANASIGGHHTDPRHALDRLSKVPELAYWVRDQTNNKQWARTPPDQQVHTFDPVDVH